MNEKNVLAPGFGKRIKDRRKELNMTQRKLAEKSGTAFRSIQDYESEKRTPKIETRVAIAKALDVPYNALFAPTDTDVASMWPEVGVMVENDPDPEKTQADFDRAMVGDSLIDLTNVLTKAGLVTIVSGRPDCPYYLIGKDLRPVRLSTSDYISYFKWQLGNITNQHYGYVDLLRKIEGLSSDTNGSTDVESTSPDA